MNSFARIVPSLASLVFAVALAASASAQPPQESSPATNPAPGSLLFRNGDLLYGTLLAIDAQSGVRWQHPDASAPIEFKPDNIVQIDFPAPNNSAAYSNNACRLLLANGDLLEGGLVSCDREAIVLQTWYAGRLSIPRASAQSLVFIPPSPEVFNGITGLDGWTQGSSAAAFPGAAGEWVYRKGAFYADKPASIARDLKLPDVAEIQFDLAWKDSLNLAIALYTDSLQPILLAPPGQAANCDGFYSLRFYDSTLIYTLAIKRNAPYTNLGQLFVPSLNGKDRLHVDLRVSKPRHKIALFLDDSPVKVWDDPEGFIGEGTGLRFVQNQGVVKPTNLVKLSNLHITKWDGIFAETPADAATMTNDTFWPENGEKVPGVIESIANGKMTASTTNGPVEIPLTELRAIDFARRQTAPPQAQDATVPVRATFAQGGGLTFSLESWQPNEMIIRSAEFGRARFNPAVFTRLQFLIPGKNP